MICTPHYRFFGSNNQGRLEGWGISTYGEDEKCVQDFGGGLSSGYYEFLVLFGERVIQ